MRRFASFFWRGPALRAAKARVAAEPPRVNALRARAETAAELARRAVEPRYVPPRPENEAVACELYRQSAHWALLALDGAGDSSRPLADLWRTTDARLLTEAAGGADSARQLEAELSSASFASFAERGFEACSALRFRLGAFTTHLLEALDAPRREVRLVRVQRALRLGLFFAVCASIAVAIVTIRSLDEQKRDFARGKPWRASSSGANACRSPLQFCDESPAFFFHTQEEKDPWVEIDLGTKTPISTVRVLNRQDCCTDRAAPLVVEVSNDQTAWKQVARRDDPFKTWKAEFAPTPARWIRVRAARKTMLHLHQVRVLP